MRFLPINILAYISLNTLYLKNRHYDKLNMSPKTCFNENLTLKDFDPEMYNYIKLEEDRIKSSIDLIASENFASIPVLECVGSCLSFKYSEGTVGKRYYGGCEIIDKIESLCKERALKAFGLDPTVWDVNVQSLSGSPANVSVMVGLLDLHDKIMGLNLTSGGHLTHGYYMGHKNINATSKFFTSLSYELDPETGLIDYKQLAKLAKMYAPKLIIAGASSYTRFIEYDKFREVCDSVGAYLLSDMSHISGLVSAGLHPSPFEHSDVVTTTTHKTMKGPRAALIFYNIKRHPDIKAKIDAGVFPVMQGGPHNNAIAGIATQLKQLMTPEWKDYASTIIRCAKKLASELDKMGFDLLTGGTDNHTVMVSLKKYGLTGSKCQSICDAANISISKATFPGDNTSNPSGVRLGTAALVSRGCKEEEMVEVAMFLKESFDLAKELQEKYGKMLKDFNRGVAESDKVKDLRSRVEAWARKLPAPGM